MLEYLQAINSIDIMAENLNHNILKMLENKI